MGRSTLVRGAIFLATVAAASAILVLGTGSEAPDLEVGDMVPAVGGRRVVLAPRLHPLDGPPGEPGRARLPSVRP